MLLQQRGLKGHSGLSASDPAEGPCGVLADDGVGRVQRFVQGGQSGGVADVAQGHADVAL